MKELFNNDELMKKAISDVLTSARNCAMSDDGYLAYSMRELASAKRDAKKKQDAWMKRAKECSHVVGELVETIDVDHDTKHEIKRALCECDDSDTVLAELKSAADDANDLVATIERAVANVREQMVSNNRLKYLTVGGDDMLAIIRERTVADDERDRVYGILNEAKSALRLLEESGADTKDAREVVSGFRRKFKEARERAELEAINCRRICIGFGVDMDETLEKHPSFILGACYSAISDTIDLLGVRENVGATNVVFNVAKPIMMQCASRHVAKKVNSHALERQATPTQIAIDVASRAGDWTQPDLADMVSEAATAFAWCADNVDEDWLSRRRRETELLGDAMRCQKLIASADWRTRSDVMFIARTTEQERASLKSLNQYTRLVAKANIHIENARRAVERYKSAKAFIKFHKDTYRFDDEFLDKYMEAKDVVERRAEYEKYIRDEQEKYKEIVDKEIAPFKRMVGDSEKIAKAIKNKRREREWYDAMISYARNDLGEYVKSKMPTFEDEKSLKLALDEAEKARKRAFKQTVLNMAIESDDELRKATLGVKLRFATVERKEGESDDEFDERIDASTKDFDVVNDRILNGASILGDGMVYGEVRRYNKALGDAIRRVWELDVVLLQDEKNVEIRDAHMARQNAKREYNGVVARNNIRREKALKELKNGDAEYSRRFEFIGTLESERTRVGAEIQELLDVEKMISHKDVACPRISDDGKVPGHRTETRYNVDSENIRICDAWKSAKSGTILDVAMVIADATTNAYNTVNLYLSESRSVGKEATATASLDELLGMELDVEDIKFDRGLVKSRAIAEAYKNVAECLTPTQTRILKLSYKTCGNRIAVARRMKKRKDGESFAKWNKRAREYANRTMNDHVNEIKRRFMVAIDDVSGNTLAKREVAYISKRYAVQEFDVKRERRIMEAQRLQTRSIKERNKAILQTKESDDGAIREAIEVAIDALSPKAKETIVMFFGKEPVALREVARRLGKSVGTVSKARNMALVAIAKEVGKTCPGSAEVFEKSAKLGDVNFFRTFIVA